jgi:CDP-glucose 4,6-dehydratase
MNKNFWKNRKVLIIGHTGFKGSWLSVYLHLLGARIYGYSLKEKKKSIFAFAHLRKVLRKSFYGNILDKNNLVKIFKTIKPEIVFHFAAQPLVSYASENPLETFDVNLVGTANIISSLSKTSSVKLCLVTTTDKVYKPSKYPKYFSEKDYLEGSEAYSCSKVCVEEYLKSVSNFLRPKLVSVRSGNVIGIGDYHEGRIIPDIIQSIKTKKKLLIRNLSSIRPWLHVLDSLNGYINLTEKIILGQIQKKKFSSWNFAPKKSDHVSVLSILKKFKRYHNFKFEKRKNRLFVENKYLRLSFAKSKRIIKWSPIYSIDGIINEIALYCKKKPTYEIMKLIIDNFNEKKNSK